MGMKMSRKEAMSFISHALSEAKAGHDTHSKYASPRSEMSEGEKISQAIDDITDGLILPPCEICGGHLIFDSKKNGGGIKCVGFPIDHEDGYDYNNGCGMRYYTMSQTNPVILRRIK